MAERAVIYEDVEVLEHDGRSLTCRIGNDRVVVRRYVPIDGTMIRQTGDRGRLALPRWYVEQQGLPLERHPSDHEVRSADGRRQHLR